MRQHAKWAIAIAIVIACGFITACDTTAPSASSTATAPSILVGSVTIGVKNDQPGTGWQNHYQRSGFDIDLANYLGKKLNFTPVFEDVPSSRRDAELQQGGVKLMIASYSITSDRKKFADFAGPYLRTSGGFLVRTDQRQHIQRLSDLAGKQVCTAAGTTSEAELRENENIHYTSLRDFADCVQGLEDKQYDAVYTDQIILYGYAQQYPDLSVVPDMRLGKLNFYGIALPKGHKSDCERIVAALRDFLGVNWDQSFADNLPSVETIDKNWQTDFSPMPSDLDVQSSCQ
jgi:glutamate transport system substrate-binding protein